MNRRVLSLALVAAMLPMAGCYDRQIAAGNFFGVLFSILSGGGSLKAKSSMKVDTTV